MAADLAPNDSNLWHKVADMFKVAFLYLPFTHNSSDCFLDLLLYVLF